MANFGTHFAYPVPDWVAWRREEELARALATPRTPRTPRPSAFARFASALRRFVRAWAKSQAYNAFL
jgi:hypothetical protein